MRQFKMLLLVALFAISTVATATTEPINADNPTTISKTVSELLANPEFQVSKEINAKVTLMVNDAQELVVVNVETEDENIASFIKSRLNYKKVTQQPSKTSVIVPVVVVPGD